jgi:hypothetical protein
MQISETFATVLRRAAIAFALVLLCFLAGELLSPHRTGLTQGAGTVGIQTTNIPVFSAQTTTASSGGVWQCGSAVNAAGVCPVFRDFGFAANFLTFCDTSFVGSIDLEWSPSNNLATFLPLTTATYSGVGDSGCHTLQVGGYFPNLRSTATITSGSVSAWYTASASPIPLYSAGIGSSGQTSPVVCDATGVLAISNGVTGFALSALRTGDTVVVCGFSVSFLAATSTGTLALAWASSNACATPTSTWILGTTSGTPQALIVPLSERSPVATWQYLCVTNNSGASAELSFSWASVHL